MGETVPVKAINIRGMDTMIDSCRWYLRNKDETVAISYLAPLRVKSEG